MFRIREILAQIRNYVSVSVSDSGSAGTNITYGSGGFETLYAHLLAANDSTGTGNVTPPT
jgi:hypothetical protein